MECALRGVRDGMHARRVAADAAGAAGAGSGTAAAWWGRMHPEARVRPYRGRAASRAVVPVRWGS